MFLSMPIFSPQIVVDMGRPELGSSFSGVDNSSRRLASAPWEEVYADQGSIAADVAAPVGEGSFAGALTEEVRDHDYSWAWSTKYK